jgi:hypothetical protein
MTGVSLEEKNPVPHKCLHVAQFHIIRMPHEATWLVNVRQSRTREICRKRLIRQE